MGLILKDSQKVTLSIEGIDEAGNPAPLESVLWAASDSSLLLVTPSDDGLSATVATVGPLGTAQVSVSADAMIGDGIEELIGTIDIQVVAGQAVAIGISAGTPVPR